MSSKNSGRRGVLREEEWKPDVIKVIRRRQKKQGRRWCKEELKDWEGKRN